MDMLHKINPLGLSPQKNLRTLVENRTSYMLKQCELHVFETYQQSFSVPLKFNDLVLTSMLRGKKVMNLPSQPAFEYLPGESVIVPADAMMHIDFPDAMENNPTQCIALAIDGTHIENTINYLNEYFPKLELNDFWALNFNSLHFANNPDVAYLINKIIRICMEDNPHKDVLADLTLKELLVRVMQSQQLKALSNQSVSSSQSPLAYIVDYIKANISEKISIHTLSEKACMSKATFYRLFKRELGISPNDFILTERVNRAKQLLKKPNAKIAAVSYELGFTDANYFIRMFKKIVGVTPGVYCQSQLYST